MYLSRLVCSANTFSFFLGVLLLLLSTGSNSALSQSEQQPLFNGQNLAGWDTWLGAPQVPTFPVLFWGDWPAQIGLNNDPRDVFSVVVEDGLPAIRISGEIWGALVSREAYADYHLTLEYKWGEARFAPRDDKARNSGLLYHSVGDMGVFWSYWMRSAEFEIMQGSTGKFVSVDGVRGQANTVWDWDAAFPWFRYQPDGSARLVGGLIFRVSASQDYEKQRGEWNRLDLFVLGDSAIHYVNGHQVFSITNLSHTDPQRETTVPLDQGKIQLQSEGAEIFFRKIGMASIDRLPENRLLEEK